ncbi:MAG TPA: indolepyruvate oxidoreductase subunit beta [Planctomycetota bacterium]
MTEKVINVVFAGLGGQGVIKASDILADAAFRAGLEVKKSELHGMSQRGGSVSSDVRFGSEVLSPMVPAGEADYLVVLEAAELDANRGRLKATGKALTPELIDLGKLSNKKSINVALLGALSRLLPIPEEHWRAALESNLPEKIRSVNEEAFEIGRRIKN